MSELLLSPRLFWFAERTRQGILLADIGTDHAKLPVYLVKTGKIEKAIASDIGEGPIAHARAHISANRLSKQITTYVGDGIAHLNIETPADIAICGMGGETIIGILERAQFVKDRDIRLLLQPMTDFAMLRYYLAKNGFIESDSAIVESDGKLYQCMTMSYTGESYTLTEIEAELGKLNILTKSKEFVEYVKRRRNILQKCRDGKRKANLDVSGEEALICEYDKILENSI